VEQLPQGIAGKTSYVLQAFAQALFRNGANEFAVLERTNGRIGNLPVNFDGTNEPMDGNFFYCDFRFQTAPPVDTNPPTVSIDFPVPNAAFTNGGDLTVQGTAEDNVGLAEVFCVLTAVTAGHGDVSGTNAAVGTTNWSLDLGTNAPGVFQLMAYAQDGAGNLSAAATVYFTNLVVLTIITNIDAQTTTNEQYLVPGQPYLLAPAPLPGKQFVTWENQGVVSIDPEQEFTAETNFTVTVTFVSTNLPPGLTISSPVAGSVVQTTNDALRACFENGKRSIISKLLMLYNIRPLS
jgi:hypothetical protein